MVQLKGLGVTSSATTLKFQFHYGTIKRETRAQFATTVQSFQFHYGTIKRALVRMFRRPRMHFNSTMVQLKGAISCAILAWTSSFQFHYGTIKRASWASWISPVTYFNSTMVQLKVNPNLNASSAFSQISIPLWYN